MLTMEMIQAFAVEYQREDFLMKMTEIMAESPAYLELVKYIIKKWEEDDSIEAKIADFVLIYFLLKKAVETKEMEKWI